MKLVIDSAVLINVYILDLSFFQAGYKDYEKVVNY